MTKATEAPEVLANHESDKDLRDLLKTIDRCRERIRSFVDEGKMVAMNTNIEASRLGEQGRGFQILADHLSQLLTEAAAVSDMLTRATGIASAAMPRPGAKAEDQPAR
jgi:methyl-accepting chemotaxis protein